MRSVRHVSSATPSVPARASSTARRSNGFPGQASWPARAIYAIIGVLALKLAIGSGGKLTNQQGALSTVANQPFGSLLLTLLAIGLGGLRDCGGCSVPHSDAGPRARTPASNASRRS